MKSILKVAFLLLLPLIAKAQQSHPDSLRTILQNATTDMARFNASVDFYFFFIEANRDSAFFYSEKRLALARKNKIALAEAAALVSKAYQYNAIGKYSDAFRNLTEALQIVEDPKTGEAEGWKVTQYPIPGKNKQIVQSTIHHVLGGVFRNTANYEQEIIQLKLAVKIAAQINHPDRQMTGNMNLASAYLKMGQLDSALYFAKAAQLLSNNPLAQGYIGNNLLTIGDIFLARGDNETAKKTYYEGLSYAYKHNNQADVANLNHKLFRVYLMEVNKDSVLSYSLKNLHILKSVVGVGYREIGIGVGYEDLSLAYQLNNIYDSAYKYQGLALVSKDSMYRAEIKNIADFQKLSLGEALRLENLEKEKIQTQSKIRTYGFLAMLCVLSIVGFILYRNNRQKQKANGILQEQKEKVESTLHELKSTQAQLIQSEKMASLGELTAGIAHEIQNPLNFVNNFSEVSAELLEEIEEERAKSRETRDETLVSEILGDIKQNLEKINHHGKRADAIVKGMLEHSRTSSGEKVLTDLNALADDFLRLTYQSFLAKNPNFKVELQTNLDPDIPKISVIPQDIGKVLLNLYSNAFYAVNERSKPDPDFQPLVQLTTRNLGGKIEVGVKDNGPGIPDAIKSKIFQPFFTTKPTGQGTGLGLSLSYDIVKAHGGEIRVESQAGTGTDFIIYLPMSNQ
ncbi:ATP-binding protein [Cognataquiflexum rubidum]|uniref:tetratricopeptide repeat-containing sensor histidine kinase n=1 Tax=Cognataquiflexum rubidum TaxID=2922273 RepID=UPI001F12A4D4|nr:ATP-binding protein [Cognataquiflexum rubidum]MCH6235770.1 ATP-binding protein [Cognataquiflexum rubidum]